MTTNLLSEKGARQSTISFVFPADAARRVSLAGDFNNWDLEDMPMYKGSDGVWYLSVSLTPGRHEYRFVADGVRQGSENRVKIVSAEIIGGKAKPRDARPGEPGE
jgi:1,4-alpha-glucan branching enzyme